VKPDQVDRGDWQTDGNGDATGPGDGNGDAAGPGDGNGDAARIDGLPTPQYPLACRLCSPSAGGLSDWAAGEEQFALFDAMRVVNVCTYPLRNLAPERLQSENSIYDPQSSYFAHLV